MKEVLKQLREKERYSQAQLANILGVSRLSYLKYEAGEVEPPLSVVRKLSKIYGVTYGQLIDNRYTQSNVEYSIPEIPPLKVAEPAENYYGTSYGIEYLTEQVELLKNMVQSLIDQKEEEQMNKSFLSKSRIFNKDAFFKEVGKLNMDSSFISELRESSLI